MRIASTFFQEEQFLTPSPILIVKFQNGFSIFGLRRMKKNCITAEEQKKIL